MGMFISPRIITRSKFSIKMIYKNMIESETEENILIKEEWRSPPAWMMLSNYEVSNLGNMRNKSKPSYIFQIKPCKSGYIETRLLRDDGETKWMSVHIVVANTFVDNPDNKPSVNHKDKVRTNNKASNLEFCTISEQNMKINKVNAKKRVGIKVDQYDLEDNFIKTWDTKNDIRLAYKTSEYYVRISLEQGAIFQKEFKLKYTPDVIIPGEIWKGIGDDYPNILVSNKGGRVKTDSGQITTGSAAGDGYLSIQLRNYSTGLYFNFNIHRLICFAFKPLKNYSKLEDYDHLTVNHLDLIRSNNNLENLEWVTHKQNIDHSLDARNRTIDNLRSKIIVKIDPKTLEILEEFTSISVAARAINNKNKRIAVYCNGLTKRKLYKGFYWQYKENYRKFIDNKEYIDIPITRKSHNARKVLQIDIKTKDNIQEFPSIKKASEQTGVDRISIGMCCREQRRIAGGYFWAYKENQESKQ